MSPLLVVASLVAAAAPITAQAAPQRLGSSHASDRWVVGRHAREPVVLPTQVFASTIGEPFDGLVIESPASSRIAWSDIYADLRAAHVDVQAVFDSGGTLADGLAVDIGRGAFTLGLLVDHSPDPEDTVCSTSFASYAVVTPQVRASVELETGYVAAMLWKDDTDPLGDVCLQVFAQSDDLGATCYYRDCLAAGGSMWMEAVLEAKIPQAAAHVRAAMDDAGPGGPDQVRDAILYLLELSAAGLFDHEL